MQLALQCTVSKAVCQALSCLLPSGLARPLISVPVWHWSVADMQVRLVGQSQSQPAGRSEVRQRVLNTPMPGGGTMQTPMPPGWKNAEFGGAVATVVRKAGRGAKTKAGSAIVITCAGTSCSNVCMLLAYVMAAILDHISHSALALLSDSTSFLLHDIDKNQVLQVGHVIRAVKCLKGTKEKNSVVTQIGTATSACCLNCLHQGMHKIWAAHPYFCIGDSSSSCSRFLCDLWHSR